MRGLRRLCRGGVLMIVERYSSLHLVQCCGILIISAAWRIGAAFLATKKGCTKSSRRNEGCRVVLFGRMLLCL